MINSHAIYDTWKLNTDCLLKGHKSDWTVRETELHWCKKKKKEGKKYFFHQTSMLYDKNCFRKPKAQEGVSSLYVPNSVGGQVQMEIKVHLNRGMAYQHLV